MKKAEEKLDYFGVKHRTEILSAHRTPNRTTEFVKLAEEKGIKVIIAGAGKAAHLAGFLAAQTVIPVIGVPIKTPDLGGMDSLLSTVQMPAGVPVATVTINGAENAAVLAAEILATSDRNLREKLWFFKNDMGEEIHRQNIELKK
jgi:5-(carboxyamino)imidazole ribonucleotide mutase